MISLNVNGQTYQVNVTDTSTPLLWVLRDILGLTGTKYGCGKEICGACTVLVNGVAQTSCQMDVSSAVGKKITTIEGLAAYPLPDNPTPPPGLGEKLQAAWVNNQVPQCGYCQSGWLMAAADLLTHKPHPAPADINEIKNICICGTYQRIRAAILDAANS
ncbi:MAG: (2Fe-2S)-binding protein [Chthoniobacteraceae bacterium]